MRGGEGEQPILHLIGISELFILHHHIVGKENARCGEGERKRERERAVEIFVRPNSKGKGKGKGEGEGEGKTKGRRVFHARWEGRRGILPFFS